MSRISISRVIESLFLSFLGVISFIALIVIFLIIFEQSLLIGIIFIIVWLLVAKRFYSDL